jgi:hypothetical protein
MKYYTTEVNFFHQHILGGFQFGILPEIIRNIGDGSNYWISSININSLVFCANSKESIYKIVNIIYEKLKYILFKENLPEFRMFKYYISLNIDSVDPNNYINFKVINQMAEQYGNQTIILPLFDFVSNNYTLFISSNNKEIIEKIIYNIQIEIYSYFSLFSFPKYIFLNDNLTKLYFKNKVLRILSCIPELNDLKWINNSFDNIFENDIFITAIQNSRFLKIDFFNKKVYYHVLNPEDDLFVYNQKEEIINNIKKDFIIQEPIYSLEKLIIQENYLDQQRYNLNINANEFIPNLL